MNDIAIKVEGLSKSYKMYPSPAERIKELLHPFAKKYHKEFWALRDVSFEVKKGETVGIIGRNGSGKSTLLQVLCGILQPTEGEVKVNGRIAALLELGAGFNPEFTGRENVYMNGAILGLSSEEVNARFDDIAAFADIGDFLDQPVKTYSSGMYVRLAFSVAINVDPEIFVVDEALAVGDTFFVQKCIRKLDEFRDKGVNIIFVSHDMVAIKRNCTEVILLDKGETIVRGVPKEIVDIYNGIIFEEVAANIQGDNGLRTPDIAARHKPGKKQRYGTRQAEITDVSLYNSEGKSATSVSSLESTEIKVGAFFHEDLSNVLVGLIIRNSIGIEVYMTNTDWKGFKIPMVRKNTNLEVTFAQKMSLIPGDYLINISVCQIHPEGIRRLDYIVDILEFKVLSTEEMSGICNLDSSIKVEEFKA